VGHNGAIDAAEHLRYAEYLASHWALPSKSENYEYASPPLFQATAVVAEKLVRTVPAAAMELRSDTLTRGLWLILVTAGACAMTVTRRRFRLLGATALALGGLWGLDEAVMLSKSEPWTAGQLIALACGAGLIVVTGLIARELWPGDTRRALAAGAFVAAYPVVYRMSIIFHPEMPFALLSGIAMLQLLRGARLGWPTRLGWWLGAACGAAILTRQPGALLALCLLAAALRVGGRAVGAFTLRAALAIVLIAGPWWIYATYRWHNPLQSNLLLTPAKMLSGQPASFFISAPLRALVLHPYRPDFTNELLPKLHADLWSDWYGALHPWIAPSRIDRVTASSQSVLGFVGDALALAGLVLLALPATLRVALRRSRAPADLGLGLLALVAVAAFAVYVATLIRFPQRDGDPIKSSYLLFTAPCWAIFSVTAWAEVRARWRALNVLLMVAAVLYLASYGTDLGGALAQSAPVGNLGELRNAVDLSTFFQQNSPNPGIGGPIELLVGVNENGGQDATGVTLTVDLSPAMKLLGAPYVPQGRCSHTAPIRCDLGEIRGGQSTYIRFGVDVNAGGAQTMTATATSGEIDFNPRDNTSSHTVNLGPG
jgi:4-amino-4-deoxy-L-arabinose transferase-like glycosyltransferase